jgi:hypothetical protein
MTLHMNVLSFVEQFFAGAFLCNCLPHLAAGLQGQAFPSPFAKPRGIGNSSPLVNVWWGLFNLAAGLVLLSCSPVSIGLNPGFFAALLGAAVLGSYTAVHFGKVRGGK